MLVDNLKTLQGTSLCFYLKLANFHWNIEGPDFPQYHAFLGDFYGDVYDTVDPLAEYVRALNSYAPGSMARMLELTVIEEYSGPQIAWDQMFTIAYNDTTTLINLYKDVFDVATGEREQGIANFCADQMDHLEKRLWMIRSILKKA
jgi:starvation-inducible DNA-binding protein